MKFRVIEAWHRARQIAVVIGSDVRTPIARKAPTSDEGCAGRAARLDLISRVGF